jgi:hypothetical protein
MQHDSIYPVGSILPSKFFLQYELLILMTSNNEDSNDLVSTSKTGVRVDNNKEWTLVASKKHIEKSNI